jgi:hypothetical protein
VQLGRYYGKTTTFNRVLHGRMDDFRVYDNALSQSEVEKLFGEFFTYCATQPPASEKPPQTAECRFSKECPAEHACLKGQCTDLLAGGQECTVDSDCGTSGDICSSGFCLQSCSTHEDCGEGSYCNIAAASVENPQGFCFAQSEEGSDVLHTRVSPTCTFDNQCERGSQCIIPEGETKGECQCDEALCTAEGNVCYNQGPTTMCIPYCLLPSDCKPELTCRYFMKDASDPFFGACGCTSDRQCNLGAQCVSNICLFF